MPESLSWTTSKGLVKEKKLKWVFFFVVVVARCSVSISQDILMRYSLKSIVKRCFDIYIVTRYSVALVCLSKRTSKH